MVKIKIELDNGKYTYLWDGKHQRALRHGEPWRDLAGDNLTLLMAFEIEKLRSKISELEGQSAQPVAETEDQRIERLRVAFETVWSTPDNSGIEWYPARTAYLTKKEMWESYAKGKTDAFIGWRLAADYFEAAPPAVPDEHDPHCNLNFPATMGSDDDFCDCGASKAPQREKRGRVTDLPLFETSEGERIKELEIQNAELKMKKGGRYLRAK